MRRSVLALMLIATPLLLSGCIGYSERVVVRDRPHAHYPPPYGGYWAPKPHYGHGWRRW